MKKKAPLCSGFSSVYTRSLKDQVRKSKYHVLDIRATYVVQTYLPLIRNFYPYAGQQPNIGRPPTYIDCNPLPVAVRVASSGTRGGFTDMKSPHEDAEEHTSCALGMSSREGGD